LVEQLGSVPASVASWREDYEEIYDSSTKSMSGLK
jgi:hypothetical protein